MKSMNFDREYDQESWNKLNESLENDLEIRDKVSAKIDEQWKMLNKEHLAFTQKCMFSYFYLVSSFLNF
jgi:hypothetical protein